MTNTESPHPWQKLAINQRLRALQLPINEQAKTDFHNKLVIYNSY